MLKVGFARVDITPPLGMNIAGYYEKRIANGILDPLLATAVAFDDGNKKGVILSVDILRIVTGSAKIIAKEIAKAIGSKPESIYIASTHTHVGPSVPGLTSNKKNTDGNSNTSYKTAGFDDYNAIFKEGYAAWFKNRLVDAAKLAVADTAPSKLFYTHGEAKDVSFIRRYRMKDGTIRTNPGWQNPDIVEPIGKADEESSLIIIKREGKPEIGIVHFQVHPDLIGRTKWTADYPKFVRSTYELNVPNSLCMYINGTQGDTNHIDVRLDPEKTCAKGYERAKYMGKKIAMSVLSNYELAKEIDGDKIAFLQRDVKIKYNKGTPEELEEAERIAKIYYEKGSEAAVPGGNAGMRRTQIIAKSIRIVSLMNKPDYVDLKVSALRVGDIIFGGFPGEPFTEFGRAFKDNAGYTLALPTCLTNGGEGYYPAISAFEEGAYEANSTPFEKGTGEKLLGALIDMAKELKKH